MPKFKVVNPGAPEEIDFYQDIPLVDPDTGADQLDSDGNILVKRYVNHTVSLKGINEVKNALPAIKTNTQNLEELYQYSHAQNEAQQVAITNNASAIVDLQTSTSEMALDLDTLKNKINGIQGIDIDDLKDYVYTQVPLIKNSYLPLTGGTITGNLNIEEGTITGSLTGVASNATADVNNKKLTSYVADIMGANAQLSIIKGDGTTSVVSINNVLNATKATQDGAGNVITDTYVKKTGDTLSGTLTFTTTNNWLLRKNVNTGAAFITGGTEWTKSANLQLYGGENAAASGKFILMANNGTNRCDLEGRVTGELTWGGTHIVRSVNGIKANEQGNVVIKDLVNIIRKNDGNDYYDDSDITSLIYAGNGAGTIRNEVANGNFARVHPGQTIRGKATGTTYIVVGCNIYKYRSDLEIHNHIGLMPIQLIGNASNLLWSGRTYAGSGVNNTTQGYAPWASDNDTESKNQTSCYRDSYIAKTVLPKVDNLWLKPDFENQGISVLTFRNIDAITFDENAVCMSNPNWKGCATSWWLGDTNNGLISKRLVLPSEPEIYGHYAWAGSSFESESQCTQLPLFRHIDILKIYTSANIWLKDSASASDACCVGALGSHFFPAGAQLRVCPIFLIA